ncbi:efflux RND transporter periplasmic adaptor subunit [bacterium]|nr:efflux RND transporter periplasmic adaptor subunit [bacterium]
MNNRNCILALTVLAALLSLAGCPAGQGGKSATAVDSHDEHDHAAHAEAEPVEDEHDHAAHAEAAPAEDEHDHAAHAEDGAQPDEHAGHDDHAGHEDGPAMIELDAQQIRELGIASAPAGAGSLGRDLELTGEVGINEDSVTHVIPRVNGIVRKVHYVLGDNVRQGAVMLELDSTELAEHKSAYLAVLSQLELLEETAKREQMLVEKGISAEQDYLEAKQAVDEKRIEKRGIEQTLHALGVSDEQIAGIIANPEASLTGFTVYAPASGEIIEKHVTAGEMVGTEEPVFTIGNLNSLWVHLNVYPEDMADVRKGLEVLVDPGHGIPSETGYIDYIEPIVGEATRTAVARVVLERASEAFRPGLFVTGHVEIGGDTVDIVVPRDAVIELDEDKLVFVRHGESFEPRVVSIGRTTASGTEIVNGLSAGEEIVVEGAFQLKAELLKGTFDPHAGHAH